MIKLNGAIFIFGKVYTHTCTYIKAMFISLAGPLSLVDPRVALRVPLHAVGSRGWIEP
jgi:hypothetical protein